jgi:ABC-2 type transport system permease protein
MTKFLTLMRRDIADNRGALIITPLVVAAILLSITILAALSGGARFGVDPKDFRGGMAEKFKADIEADGGRVTAVVKGENGSVTVTDENGNTHRFGGLPTKEDLKEVAPVVASATGVASLLPLAISGIAILFALAGALHDERKDRTILFWKSLPVSDLQTVGAKMATIVGFGLGFAFVVSVVLHIAITTIAAVTINQFADMGIGTMLAALFGASAKLWLLGLCVLVFYVLGALPVYGWATMVSFCAHRGRPSCLYGSGIPRR